MSLQQARGAELSPDGLMDRAQEGLELARSLGADSAEVYLWQAEAHDLSQNHRTRSFESSDRSGVSVRLLKDRRLASAKTSGLRPDEIAWAVRRAGAIADLVPRQKGLERFASAPDCTAPPSQVHRDIIDLDPDRIRGVADAIHDAAYERREPNYFSARYQVNVGTFVVANTEGVQAWDRQAHESFILEARCNQGDTHKAATVVRSGREPLDRLYDLGQEAQDAVERAHRATRPVYLGKLTDEVILDGFCSALLVEKLLPSLGGQSAAQGRSYLSGKLGERIADPALTLVDRPQGPHGCRHQRVDDEGIPTQETPLVVDGVLESYLYSWGSAQRVGEAPTGHGLRPITNRYGSQPSQKPVNPVMAPGDKTLHQLVAGADEAVLVQDALLGSFTMDKMSGEFSFVAPMAFHVQGGEVKDALVSASISGNLFDVLGRIEGLGSQRIDLPKGSYVPLHLAGVTGAT